MSQVDSRPRSAAPAAPRRAATCERAIKKTFLKKKSQKKSTNERLQNGHFPSENDAFLQPVQDGGASAFFEKNSCTGPCTSHAPVLAMRRSRIPRGVNQLEPFGS